MYRVHLRTDIEMLDTNNISEYEIHLSIQEEVLTL